MTAALAARSRGDGQPVLRHMDGGVGSTLFEDPESLMISFRFHGDMPSRPRDALNSVSSRPVCHLSQI